MKSMKNFAAQQLSKKEMNNVKGGMGSTCTLYDETGAVLMSGPVTGSLREAQRELMQIYGEYGWLVRCHSNEIQMIQRDATYMWHYER